MTAIYMCACLLLYTHICVYSQPPMATGTPEGLIFSALKDTIVVNHTRLSSGDVLPRRDTYLVSCGQDEREHGAKPTLASADPAEASGRIHPPVGWLVAGLVCDNAWPSSRSIHWGSLHVAMLPPSAMCSRVVRRGSALCTQHSARWQM
jgi:hypothetical protein